MHAFCSTININTYSYIPSVVTSISTVSLLIVLFSTLCAVMVTLYVLGTRLDSVMSVLDVVVELHVDTSGTPFSTVHHEMVKEKV